jgi:hypothetical protein
MSLTPSEQRDIETIGQVAVDALNALKAIHALAVDPAPDALYRIRGAALATIVNAERRMEDIA